jgi:hypothetical protein
MTKFKALFTISIFMLITMACTDTKEDQITEGSNINFYPDKIIEFHITKKSPEMLFIFTAYHAPYSGVFETITLKKDGTFLRDVYQPGYAHKGTIRALFSEKEVEKIEENLDIISHSKIDYSDFGTYNFTVTLLVSQPTVISCNETNCPKNFCYFYELTKIAATKQHPSYSPPSFIEESAICPANYQEPENTKNFLNNLSEQQSYPK